MKKYLQKYKNAIITYFVIGLIIVPLVIHIIFKIDAPLPFLVAEWSALYQLVVVMPETKTKAFALVFCFSGVDNGVRKAGTSAHTGAKTCQWHVFRPWENPGIADGTRSGCWQQCRRFAPDFHKDSQAHYPPTAV